MNEALEGFDISKKLFLE